MPVYQGIKLSIVSQLELRIHPEFPHPESSQFTYRSRNVIDETSVSSFVTPTIAPDSKADRILGRSSTISVYIPSHPGARFWLRYDVTEAREPKSPWYYFKLFMNGRHVTSWGTHSILKPSGQVMRALYDPTSRWNYKCDETIYKNCGTEMRPFYFSNINGRSIADDGGLIEVRVFRAKGRRKRLPTPAEFKPQDQYGLVMPSTGLMDDPKEAKFYDWLLIDPTNNPFTTFKFHYRSWDNLSSLNLIPTSHPRTLLFPSPSLLSLNCQSNKAHQKKVAAKRSESKRQDEDDSDTLEVDGCYMQNSTSNMHGFATSTQPVAPLTNHTRDYKCKASKNADKDVTSQVPRSPSPYYRNLSPPALEALGFSAPPPVPLLPPAAQLEWAQILNRPLPEIPHEYQSSKIPRRPSASSDTPFLTHSIMERYDRHTLSPSPILKTAAELQFRKLNRPSKLIKIKRSYLVRLPSPSENSDVPAPLALPTKQQSDVMCQNITPCMHRESSQSPSEPTPKECSSECSLGNPQGYEEYESYDDAMPLSLTESEWLSRAQTFTNGTINSRQGEQIDSFGKGKNTDDAEERALLRQQALDWYESAAGNSVELADADTSREHSEPKVRGVWF